MQEEDEKNKKFRALDAGDIALLKTYGLGPYNHSINAAQDDIKKLNNRINEVVGIKESDTGLAPPSQWDLVSDKQMMQEEQPLQVARCTKIINPNTDDAKYVINVKQIAKFVVGLVRAASAPTRAERSGGQYAAGARPAARHPARTHPFTRPAHDSRCACRRRLRPPAALTPRRSPFQPPSSSGRPRGAS